MSEVSKEVVCYAVGDPEILTAETIDEAVENYIEEHEGCLSELLDVTVDVQPYRRASVSDCFFDDQLKCIKERLIEDYGDPESYYDFDLSDEAEDLYKKFTDQVRQDFQPWLCEPAGSAIKVKLREYIAEADL